MGRRFQGIVALGSALVVAGSMLVATGAASAAEPAPTTAAVDEFHTGLSPEQSLQQDLDAVSGIDATVGESKNESSGDSSTSTSDASCPAGLICDALTGPASADSASTPTSTAPAAQADSSDAPAEPSTPSSSTRRNTASDFDWQTGINYPCFNQKGAWLTNRLGSCRSDTRRLRIIQETTTNGVTTRKTIGTVKYQLSREIGLLKDRKFFLNAIKVEIVGTTGVGAETTFTGAARCSQVSGPGDCAWDGADDFTFSGLATKGTVFQLEPQYAWTGAVGTSSRMRVAWDLTMANPYATNTASLKMAPRDPVRCDRKLPGATNTGCVFSAFVPSASFSAGSYGTWENHVFRAQLSGLPFELTRATAAESAANRAVACAAAPSPRPAGYQCDEYPFASTKEGAASGSGSVRILPDCNMPEVSYVPGSSGWSICLISTEMHSSQSPFLRSLYRSARILPGDKFDVISYVDQ